MFVDSAIDLIWQGVKQIEIRGAYHYQRSSMSWLMQAEHFLNVAAKYDFHIYVLDVEVRNNILDDTFFGDMRRIIDYWRSKASDKMVMLYTNPNIYQSQLYPSMQRLYGAAGLQWLDNVPLWIAQYWKSPSPDKDPEMPKQRTSWHIYQFSETGKPNDYGTESVADEDVFNGTAQNMRDWLKIKSQLPNDPEPPYTPPPEPSVESQLYGAEVIVDAARPLRLIVRTYPQVIPDTQTAWRVYSGELFRGKIWMGNNYVWMKITDASRPELIHKWVAVRSADMLMEGAKKFITLRSLPEIPPPNTGIALWQIRGDEELAEFQYKSRTDPDSGWTGFKCTPSVFRFYKAPIEKQGDFRVDISPLLTQYMRINGAAQFDSPKLNYLFASNSAIFNTRIGDSGYPRQMYITMSGNLFEGELVEGGKWLKFKTLTPQSDASGMTKESHPQFVHHFDLVCYIDKKTGHSQMTPQGLVQYLLTTVEGVGYIAARYVRKMK